MGTPRTRRHLILAPLLTAVLIGCGEPGSPMVGVVVTVDGNLEEVRSFTVVAGSETITFLPHQDGIFDFPLPHLREHLQTGQPVRVGYVEENGLFYAVTLEDA